MSALRLIRGYLVIATIAIALVPVNICQMSSLILLPFSRRKFMRANMWIKQTYCGLVVSGARICGNTLRFSGDPARAENALIFANHQSMIDIILIWTWAEPARTIGWIKWFAKNSLKYIPGLGWGMMFVNTLFVKREWARDAESIKATFAKLRKGSLPTWLVIFPEGTRMKPAKLAVSQEFARKRSLEVFNHVLNPRGKGIYASLSGLEGHLAAVYDITIEYAGPIPSLTHFFTRGGYNACIHAVRFDVAQVPQRERDLNQWLYDRFKLKNNMMAEGLWRNGAART
jgi:1-acyl-sn-glycerol-3-phosphate acyltransferase